jgi:hypothetical protein
MVKPLVKLLVLWDRFRYRNETGAERSARHAARAEQLREEKRRRDDATLLCHHELMSEREAEHQRRVASR